MNALPSHVPLLSPPARSALSPEALAACVRALDPGSRALLDLSLRRKLPFEAMAGVLHTDPFDLARRRARAVARIAAELDLEGAGVVASVKAALARLPDDAWGVPLAPKRPQAESMAEAARALMIKLEEHRARIREASIAAAADPFDGAEPKPEAQAHPEPEDQPTVESEAVQAWEPAPTPPVAATDMAAAFAHHPAFAVETADEAALPPLAEALARAAASERAAAAAETAEDPADQPTMETPAIRIPVPPTDRPAPRLSAPPADEREPRRRLARGGIVVGLLLALLRLLLGRR
jgi:hypothetical protein